MSDGGSTGGKFNQAKAADAVERARIATHEAAKRRGSKKSDGWQKWEQAAQEFHRLLKYAYPPGFWENFQRLKCGELKAIEMAVVFLEDDAWFFRSGYVKADLIRFIGRIHLTEEYVDRLRQVVLHAVDNRDRREFRAYCRLARQVWNDELRKGLLQRTASLDDGIRRRANWMLSAVCSRK